MECSLLASLQGMIPHFQCLQLEATMFHETLAMTLNPVEDHAIVPLKRLGSTSSIWNEARECSHFGEPQIFYFRDCDSP